MAALLSIGALLALSAGSTLGGTVAWQGAIAEDGWLSGAEIHSEHRSATPVRVEAGDADLSVEATLEPADGSGARAWLPVPGESGVALRVSAAHEAVLRLGPMRLSQPPVVLAGRTAAALLGHRDDSLALAADELPGLPQPYAHIRALAIDDDALARLPDASLRALLAYVGNCGRLLLLGADDAAADLIAARAGCGGRLVVAAPEPAAAERSLEALLGASPDPLPDDDRLEVLLPPATADLRLAAHFLLGFLGLFLVLTALRQTRTAAGAVSVLATLAAGLVWTGGSHQRFVAWAEVADGEVIARYASLGVASSRGRSIASPPLQELGRDPQRISGSPATLEWGGTVRSAALRWPATLFERLRVYSLGSFPVEPNLRAGISAGEPMVCNHGAGPTPAATLYWRDRTYAVPSLERGERVSLGDALPLTEPAAEIRLLSRRAGALALLQPLSVPGDGGDRRAWLMRSESAAEERSPCRD